MSVIADCLMKNDNPAHKPSGVFLDWNWYRIDCYKAARGEPVGVPVRDILDRQIQQRLAKAA